MDKKEEIKEIIKGLLKGVSLFSLSLAGLLALSMLFLSRTFESYWSDLWCEQCVVEPKAQIIYVLLFVALISEIVIEILTPSE